MAIPLILILVSVFVVMMLYATRRSSSSASVRRRHQSPTAVWSRRLMPVAGVILLAALILGTLDDISRTYAAAERQDETTLRAAPPSAILPDDWKGDHELLVHVLLGIQQGDGIRCLDARSAILPPSGGVVEPVRFSTLGAAYAVYPSIAPFGGFEDRPGVRVEGQYEFSAPSMSGSGGMLETMPVGRVGVVANKQLRTSSIRPFSLRTAPREPVVAAVIVHRVQRDTTLESRSAHEVLKEAGGLPAIEWGPPAPAGASSKMPGLQYFIHIGLASVVLIASCWFIAMYFRHRILAAAIVMAVMLFITSSVDGWMVGLHRDRLLAEDAPVAVRCVAADHLGYSFFYSTRARRILRESTQRGEMPSAVLGSAQAALSVRGLHVRD